VVEDGFLKYTGVVGSAGKQTVAQRTELRQSCLKIVAVLVTLMHVQ
jgi:hypothetical protein